MSAKATDLRSVLPSVRRILRRLAPHARPERWLIAGGFTALMAEVVFRLIEPWPLKVVVDAVVEPGAAERPDTERTLVLAGVAIVVAVGLRALTAYLSTVALALAGNRVLTRVRAQLFEHVQRLSIVQHQGNKVGDMVTRLTGDVGRLQEVAVTAGLPLLGNVVTLVGMTVVMAFLDLGLTLVVVTAFPVFILTTSGRAKRINSASREQRRREGDLAAIAVESLSAVKVVQAYSLEAELGRRFEHSNARSLKDGVKARRLAAGLERRTDIIVGVVTAVVTTVGAHRVLSGAMSPGGLVVFVSYLKSAFKPMRDLAKYTSRIASATASGDRIIDLLDTEPAIMDRPDARPAPAFQGDVRFDRVTASYRGEQPSLDSVDLHVRPGERIGVVGPSGSGKSTLVALLLRLHDPIAGRVSIDGHDLRDLTLASVRSQIAIVLQESVLFATSVRDNIGHGVEGATDVDIEAAARLANAHDFIIGLPEGYDTVLGERGATLSGGERQRIAIARAALRSAPIIVLDEATTGLDQDNEAEVLSALAKLTEGRTTFVIAHDPSLVRHVDRVVRIEAGRVVADGHPDQVLRSPAPPGPGPSGPPPARRAPVAPPRPLPAPRLPMPVSVPGPGTGSPPPPPTHADRR